MKGAGQELPQSGALRRIERLQYLVLDAFLSLLRLDKRRASRLGQLDKMAPTIVGVA